MEILENVAPWLDAISALVVIVGVPFAGLQLVAQKQQQHREFENMYVQRYWGIMEQFSADYRLRNKRENLSDGDRLACHSYLELCEDEVDLYEAGRVTKDTWKIWKSGIDMMLEQEVFRRLLEQTDSKRYTTLRRYIETGRIAPKYKGSKAALRGL